MINHERTDTNINAIISTTTETTHNNNNDSIIATKKKNDQQVSDFPRSILQKANKKERGARTLRL